MLYTRSFFFTNVIIFVFFFSPTRSMVSSLLPSLSRVVAYNFTHHSLSQDRLMFTYTKHMRFLFDCLLQLFCFSQVCWLLFVSFVEWCVDCIYGGFDIREAAAVYLFGVLSFYLSFGCCSSLVSWEKNFLKLNRMHSNYTRAASTFLVRLSRCSNPEMFGIFVWKRNAIVIWLLFFFLVGWLNSS